MPHAKVDPPFFGLMAEFDSAQALLDAAHKVHGAGYTKADAYSPFPIHGLAEALGFRERHVAKIVLGAGITGALVGYGLEYWTSVIALPLNIGGRPSHSRVSFLSPPVATNILFFPILSPERHAGAERIAAAVSPGVQRRALRAVGELREVLSGHRSHRPEVRC